MPPTPHHHDDVLAEDDGAEFHPSVFPIAGVPKRGPVSWQMLTAAAGVALVIGAAAVLSAGQTPASQSSPAAQAPQPALASDDASSSGALLLEPQRAGAFDGLSGRGASAAPAQNDEALGRGGVEPDALDQGSVDVGETQQSKHSPQVQRAQHETEASKKITAKAKRRKAASASTTAEPTPGLSKRSIGAVVRAGRASVGRRCWQPALAQRSFDASPLVRVTLDLQVEPSGTVSSASAATSAHGYAGLSSCLESAVRGWVFPTATGPTSVRVPFVFSDG